jgi:tetratricopeptide (TPR) repeat protein
MRRPMSQSSRIHNHLRRIAFCSLFSAPTLQAQQLTAERHRELIEDYRAGNHDEAAEALSGFGREVVRKRDTEFLAALDLDRPADRKRLLAGVLLLTETAVVSAVTAASDFYLDEAERLTTSFGEEEGIALQKDIHLAASYRLFNEGRVADALRVIEPAALRYPMDPSLQFAFGSLAELTGSRRTSGDLLEKARVAYESILLVEPANSSAALRLGRVLCLQRKYQEAAPRLRSALVSIDALPERVVGLLSLGNAMRATGSPEAALDLYRTALELDPNSQAGTVVLAYTLRELGSHEEAAAVLDSSLRPAFGASSSDSFQLYIMADSRSYALRWSELRARMR